MTIRYTQGNLLVAHADALINTVNEVGVMGKGIARMFKVAFPRVAKAYVEACNRGEVRVGRIFVTHNDDSAMPRWILHLPTKQHWRNPSRMEWIREGLADLVRVIRENQIQSVALPALGCGAGGLDWKAVRAAIEVALRELPEVDFLVFEPSSESSTASPSPSTSVPELHNRSSLFRDV